MTPLNEMTPQVTYTIERNYFLCYHRRVKRLNGNIFGKQFFDV